MYYEELVINGVLCYRTTPKGSWTAYSKEDLTSMLVYLRENQESYYQNVQLRGKLNEIRAIVERSD